MLPYRAVLPAEPSLSVRTAPNVKNKASILRHSMFPLEPVWKRWFVAKNRSH